MLPSNPDKILYMGRKMGDFPRPRRAYCGGGAGYTLSRGAVRTLVGTLYPTEECHPNWTTPQEDRMVTQCFRSIMVHDLDDVDERDEPRYHIQDADFHAKWEIRPENTHADRLSHPTSQRQAERGPGKHF